MAGTYSLELQNFLFTSFSALSPFAFENRSCCVAQTDLKLVLPSDH